MKVTGVDTSLTSTGVAVITNGIATTHTITSKPPRHPGMVHRLYRIAGIATTVVDWIDGSDLVVIEGPSFGQARQGGQHDRAGLWWRIVGLCVAHDIPIVEVPPANRAKYATGKGNAKKDHVLAAAIRRYPDVLIEGNDQADALILAAMGARALGEPIETLPVTHLAALDAITWPERIAA